jgi:peptidoglycan biosynthesis protein MviN/MurJ (putative lipid II flippase)
MVIAAGHFRQTNAASYGESVINIVSSVVLVIRFGLIGVAIGTVIAMLYRFGYYAVYLSKHILNRPLKLWIKREFINFMAVLLICFIGRFVIHRFMISTYLQWVIAGAIISLVGGLIIFMFNMLFYPHECILIWKRLFNK